MSIPGTPLGRMYRTTRWAKRARAQMRQQPLCIMCEKKGVVREANVADHVQPHKGDAVKFWLGPTQSLCFEHHNRAKREFERRGFSTAIDASGFPCDPLHPFNRARQK